LNLDKIKQGIEILISKHSQKHGKARQVIFWYDDGAAFREDFDALDIAGFEKITVEKNEFQVKHLIEKELKSKNIIVYSPEAKPPDDENWLLDIYLYSDEFSADKASVIYNDLGLHDRSLRQVIQNNLKFFDSSKRYQAIKALINQDINEAELALCFMAVLSGIKNTDADSIVRAVLSGGLEAESNDNYQDIQKYYEINKFWLLVERKYGYKTDKKSLKNLMICFLITHFHNDYRGLAFPAALNKFLLAVHNNAHVFVDNWVNHKIDGTSYRQFAVEIESEINFKNVIKGLDVKDYLECSTFDIIDKAVILSIINGLLEGSADHEKFRGIIEKRRNMTWYENYSDIYLAINAAIDLFELKSKYNDGFKHATVNEFFKGYCSDYYKFDQAYRNFYFYYAKTKVADILKNLVERVEDLYVNWYLFNLSSEWTALVKEENTIAGKQLQSWDLKLEGIKRQFEFYREHIEIPVLDKNDRDKIFIIISDGLRFEIAEELSRRIDKETRTEITLTSMLGVIPSYTQLGMASLLPLKHVREAIRVTDNGHVTVNDLDSSGIDNRDKILKEKRPDSVAIKIDELMAMNSDNGRKFVSENRVFYVYDDSIDSIGDNPQSEAQVFEAVENAINRLIAGVKKIMNLNGNNIVITSDHGFIYSRKPLEESDRVEVDSSNYISKNKRFMLGKHLNGQEGTLNIVLDYLGKQNSGLSVIVPNGNNRFKAQGGGVNYVHGGASLQEVVIPVISCRHIKGKKLDGIPQRKVDITLTSTMRKITNNRFSVTLFQKDRLEDKLKPRELSIALYDITPDGIYRMISDSKTIVFDSASKNADEREKKIQLTVKNGNYEKSRNYYLVANDVDTDSEYMKEIYNINIGIGNDFDDF